MVVGGVLVVAVVLFIILRSSSTGGPNGSKKTISDTASPPQPAEVESANKIGAKAVVLSAPKFLATQSKGWLLEVQFEWQGQVDSKRSFVFVYFSTTRGAGGGNAVNPAGGTNKNEFHLPQKKGKATLLIPKSEPALKKGDRLRLFLQAKMKNWQIPSSAEVEVPPLP